MTAPRSATRRLLTTLSLGTAMSVLGLIPLPSVTAWEFFQELGGFRRLGTLENLSIGALGVSPIISSFVMVEIVAAVVPRWRALRQPAGRPKLNRFAVRFSIAMALFQGFGIAMYLEGMQMWGFREATGWGTRIAVMMSLGAFTALELVAIALNDRWGLGSGLSSWILVTTSTSLVFMVLRFDGTWLTHTGPRLLLAAAMVTIFAIPALQPAFSPDEESAAPIGIPGLTSGVWPVSMIASSATLLSEAGSVGSMLMTALPFLGANSESALSFAATVLATLALSAAFHPISEVSRVAQRIAPHGEDDASVVERAARSVLATATARSVLFVLALLAVPLLANANLGPSSAYRVAPSLLDAPRLVLLVGIVLDLVAEWRARSASTDWVLIAAEQRVYAALSVKVVLEREGMSTLLRGMHARTCLHLLGPYVPVEIWVRAGDADRARTIVETLDSSERAEVPAPVVEEIPSAATE